MKHVLLAILLTLGLFASVRGTAPSWASYDATYEYYYVDGYDPITIADDTIDNSGADSITIASNIDIESGWQYILQKAATTGGNGTSGEIDLELKVICLQADGDTIMETYVDTVAGTTTAAGEAMLLDFGGSVFADEITLEYHTTVTTGDDTAILVGDHYLIKRRPVVISRNR